MKETITRTLILGMLASLITGCSSEPASSDSYPPITKAIVPTSHGTPHFCYQNEPQGIDKYLGPTFLYTALTAAVLTRGNSGANYTPMSHVADNQPSYTTNRKYSDSSSNDSNQTNTPKNPCS